MDAAGNTPTPTPTPTTSRPGRLRRAALAAALLAGTTLGGITVGHLAFAATDPAPTGAVNAAPASTTNAPTSQIIPDFANLVTRVRPAVVSITTQLRLQPTADDGQQQMQMMPFGMPFGQMAPGNMGPGNMGPGNMGPGEMPQEHAVEARGSGFIVNANGTIVTNNHVVKDARSVSVTMSDGTVYPAKIIGRDPRTDLAVLRSTPAAIALPATRQLGRCAAG